MQHEPFTCDNGPSCEECAWIRHAENNLDAFREVIDAAAAAEKALNPATRIPAVLDEDNCGCDLDASGDAAPDMRATLDVIGRGLRDLRRIAETERARIRECM